GPQLVEIHRLENEGDRLQRAAIADLFVTGIDPMIVIRWKDIFDTLESPVDACETVANVLEGMTLKRANGGMERQEGRRLASASGACASWIAAAPRTSACSPSAPWTTWTAWAAGTTERRPTAVRIGSSRTSPAPASSPPMITSAGFNRLTVAAIAAPTA